jgi:hypothetical protein
MSFHGGLIGTTIAMFAFAWRRKIPVWSLIDIVSAVVPIGLFFGRIANFINSELWGRPTDVPWAFVFPTGGDIARHPSQLYEAALEGIVLFLVLRLCTHKLLKLQIAALRHRRLHRRLRHRAHRRRILPRTRRAARLSLWRLADHGHDPVDPDDPARHRPRPVGETPARLMSAGLEDAHPAADRNDRADLRLRLHGDVPVRSAGGYYTTREPFGAAGDFVTAPEVSQMFGEIVGAWLVHAWRSLGRPDPFALVSRWARAAAR